MNLDYLRNSNRSIREQKGLLVEEPFTVCFGKK
jgi:hypothetical protein